jgi:two-component system sensor histidine kinase KdpD
LVVFVIVGLVVATLVTRADTRRAEALRAQAEAESMAWAIAQVASEGDPVPGLLRLLLTTLTLGGVAVLVEPRNGGAMALEASEGADPPTTVDAADITVPLSDGVVLGLRGTLDNIGDPRVLHAIAAQIASARKRKVLETEAARAAAVAETDALRTALLRAVSHDLRTPIASIKASVTSLLQPDVTWSPDDVDGFLGAIDQETDRLDHLIVNLLDMSRLEAGAIAPKSQPVDPEELVAIALRSLSANSDRIRVDIAASLPPLVTDAGLVERALANVTDNALSYTPPSSPVRVEVSKVGAEVHFRVIDRGRGLPREDRSKLFEPFRRLDDRHNRTGVGLGLAVANGFIEAVGGTITFDDTPGGGLTVDIAIPLVPADANAIPADGEVVADEPFDGKVLTDETPPRAHAPRESATGSVE